MMKKGIIYIICFLSLLFSYTSCSQNNKPSDQLNLEPISVNKEKVHKAYFASGCFWCVEAIYESIIGVNDVVSGYSGGEFSNPTYQLVNTKLTGHAETIEVTYDPKKITFSNLVDVYFGSQNIEQINGQGPDRGPQYRSIIFYQNKLQQDLIHTKIKEIEKFNKVSVAAEVYPFQKFWKAENYHQNYERLHPNNTYVRNVSIPRLKKFQKKFPHLLKINH